MEGNETIAWGAVASECRFFAGYPITPATTIFNAMLELLPPLGGICLQGEDEIAKIQKRLKTKLLSTVTGGQFSATTPSEAQVGSGFLNRLERL
jgi:hypothetical protein